MPNAPALSPQAIREIAHELRSPLGGFEAMLDLLARTPLTPEQARLVEALEASAQHLRAILAHVLPPHAGDAAQDSREPIRLGALIEAIAASASARAAKKELAFALWLDPALDRSTEIDALALRQVLENLIDNAIRMTQAGEVTLDVTAEPDGRIGFRLSDTGPGLDPARAESLLAGASNGRERQGGLGLGIAARLVARGGGRLCAEPRATGRGTCFSFDWPVSPDASVENRLLIVDDHPASRLVLRTILAALGFVCDEAASPDEALRRVRETPFAAIFTDLNMPGGGGGRIIDTLRVEAIRPALVVVSADDPGEVLGPDVAIDAAIQKPLTVPAVVAALRQLGLAPRTRQAA